MSKIQVCRSHELGEQECQDVAEKLLSKLVDSYGGSFKAQGSNYAYKHTMGVNATIEPKDGELVVNMKLGLMARPLASKLEAEVNRVLDKHFD